MSVPISIQSLAGEGTVRDNVSVKIIFNGAQ
jgi:hypothetical protein